jgi:hypothetical protein
MGSSGVLAHGADLIRESPALRTRTHIQWHAWLRVQLGGRQNKVRQINTLSGHWGLSKRVPIVGGNEEGRASLWSE